MGLKNKVCQSEGSRTKKVYYDKWSEVLPPSSVMIWEEHPQFEVEKPSSKKILEDMRFSVSCWTESIQTRKWRIKNTSDLDKSSAVQESHWETSSELKTKYQTQDTAKIRKTNELQLRRRGLSLKEGKVWWLGIQAGLQHLQGPTLGRNIPKDHLNITLKSPVRLSSRLWR